MDEESDSTSQDSSNFREAVQMNTGVPLHNVNLRERELYCALCEINYSPGSEANRHRNVCLDCEVWLEPYNEGTWQGNFEESRQRVEEALQGLLEAQWDLEERRQDVAGSWWDLEETRQDLEETRWNLEENWRILEETQRGLEETRPRLEPHRQRVKQRIESLPRVIITEEHEKKHNGLVCAICLDPLSVGNIVNELPCLHFFHPLCIAPWLKVRMSCPTCRYKISSALRNETRQNSNRRMGFQEIVPEGFRVTTSSINGPEAVVISESLNSSSSTSDINESEVVVVSESLNSSSTTSGINEPEVVVSESHNSSSTTSNINEPVVVVNESHNGTTDSSVRDREGSKGGWFLFVAAPIVSLVGIALVESLQNLLGGGRGRGSTGHVEFPPQCQ